MYSGTVNQKNFHNYIYNFSPKELSIKNKNVLLCMFLLIQIFMRWNGIIKRISNNQIMLCASLLAIQLYSFHSSLDIFTGLLFLQEFFYQAQKFNHKSIQIIKQFPSRMLLSPKKSLSHQIMNKQLLLFKDWKFPHQNQTHNCRQTFKKFYQLLLNYK